MWNRNTISIFIWKKIWHWKRTDNYTCNLSNSRKECMCSVTPFLTEVWQFPHVSHTLGNNCASWQPHRNNPLMLNSQVNIEQLSQQLDFWFAVCLIHHYCLLFHLLIPSHTSLNSQEERKGRCPDVPSLVPAWKMRQWPGWQCFYLSLLRHITSRVTHK